jgi:hypothetical protein
MKERGISKVSQEERLAIERNMLHESLFIEINALTDKLGSEEALSTIRPYVRMSAQALTLNLQRIFGIEGSDIERIAEVSEVFESLTGSADIPYDYDIEKNSNRIIRAGYVNCLNIGGPKEFCILWHEMILNGICETINPEYECKFTQMITKGDPICSYVIEKKKK